MEQTKSTLHDCARQLRAEGFNHTDSNRYARLPEKRGGKMDWARIVAEDDGNYRIERL